MGDSRRKRYKKRLQVRFWKEGDESPHSGYTTNVSMTGMFVATETAIAANERIKIEILSDDNSCVLHGEVVHATRVSPLLAELRQAGMGIRLLGVDELIGELVGRDSAKLRQDIEFRVDAPMQTGYSRPATPRADPSDPKPVSPVSEEPADPDPPGEGSEWPEAVSPVDPTLFSIRFDSGDEFLSAFRRELQHGGMFIKTQHPPRVNERVTVEIKRPTEEPIRLPARVVSRRQGGDVSDSRSPPGINVDFTDLKSALEELKRLREIALKI
jgi:Tfp pilus assembly protein PilZ